MGYKFVREKRTYGSNERCSQRNCNSSGIIFSNSFCVGLIAKVEYQSYKQNVSCNFLTLFYGTFHFFRYNPLFLNYNGPNKLFLMLSKSLLCSGLVSSVPSSLTFTVSLPDGFLFAAASVLLGFPPFLCDQVVGAPITTQVFLLPCSSHTLTMTQHLVQSQ